MKTMKFYTMAALAAGVVALPIAGVHAETMGAKTATSAEFKKVDADKSGTLNESEFQKLNMPGSFSSLDANSDAVLTLSELQATPAATSETGVSAKTGMGSTGSNE